MVNVSDRAGAGGIVGLRWLVGRPQEAALQGVAGKEKVAARANGGLRGRALGRQSQCVAMMA